jgi:hypothetical protein
MFAIYEVILGFLIITTAAGTHVLKMFPRQPERESSRSLIAHKCQDNAVFCGHREIFSSNSDSCFAVLPPKQHHLCSYDLEAIHEDSVLL